MSLASQSSAEGADIHDNHYCDHVDGEGKKCPRWGAFGFEETKSVTFWYCSEHRPLVYRGLTFDGAVAR
ncbi:MAG: hypothetical protein DI604_28150 [Delftia acidovorans]|nr:MAG: hypothetical protein DI604_28150 [Delftia acidovorans]